MKIRNKFIIPVIAILLAILMTGMGVTGTAADTSASESTSESTTHPLTYVPPSVPTTASLEEEIDKFVSENLGGLNDYEDDIRDTGNIFDQILSFFSGFLGKLIEFAQKIGDMLYGRS